MGKELKLVKCSLDNEWDNLIFNSKERTLFNSKVFLESIDTNLGLYKCFKGNELRAILVLCEDKKRENIIENKFMIYSGIVFGPPTYNQSQSQQISERHKITSFIINKLTTLYKSFYFQLSPNIIDVRPFQWHNYGIKDERKCLVDVKYTSYLDIKDFYKINSNNLDIFLKDFSSSRRQEIRYLMKNNAKVEITEDYNLLIELYEITLQKSSLKIDEYHKTRMKNITKNLINSKNAKLYISYSSTNKPASLALIAFDKFRAYYLFGANSTDFKKELRSTAVLFEAFKDISSMGIDLIDLEGVNSPKRGWFKMSFGGTLKPYYCVNYPKILSNN